MSQNLSAIAVIAWLILLGLLLMPGVAIRGLLGLATYGLERLAARVARAA